MSTSTQASALPARAAGDRLYEAMREHGPLCVGIDPHPRLLEDWGMSDDALGLRSFALEVLEAAAGTAAAVKPQVALFERHGSAGLAVLEEVLESARELGVEAVADAKRGDIGSTMAAYADAWLGQGSRLAADWVTLSPYLGFESLRPALDTAAANGRGAFVLALTSNPEGPSVQHRGGEDSVAREVFARASAANDALEWRHAGPYGLVVGATVGPALIELGIDPGSFNGLLLAPGFGAQGATAEDLARVFAGAEDRVVVSSSRGVLSHGPRREDLRAEIRRLNGELAARLG